MKFFIYLCARNQFDTPSGALIDDVELFSVKEKLEKAG